MLFEPFCKGSARFSNVFLSTPLFIALISLILTIMPSATNVSMVQQLAQHLPIKTKVAITSATTLAIKSAKIISNSGNNITTWQ